MATKAELEAEVARMTDLLDAAQDGQVSLSEQVKEIAAERNAWRSAALSLAGTAFKLAENL